MSAPLCLMTSCGSTELPSDFDIFRPSSSTTKPWVTHLAERRPSARAEADEQRALEPAAVLVAAFEVDVGRPGQLGPDRQHRLVARSRIEPHVEDVHLAREGRAAARAAREAGGQELLDGPLVPRVGAVLAEHGGGLLDERGRRHRFAARRAVDGRNRHAPGPLARDAPVGAVHEHVVDAVVAPRRHPLDGVVDGVERRFPQRLRRRRCRIPGRNPLAGSPLRRPCG